MGAPDVTTQEEVRILGVDPGTRVLGYGVLATGVGASAGADPRHVESGALRLSGSLPVRLEKIFLELRALVNRSRPQVVAIENVFHGRSFDSALKLGQARGVVMLAAQLATLAIYEFAPTQVKKGVTGNGGASKEQVQRMVCRILKLRERPASMDVSDALAVAFCCAEELGRCERLGADVVAGSSSRSGAGGKRRGAARIEALVKSGRARWVAPGGGASPRGTPKGGPAAGKE